MKKGAYVLIFGVWALLTILTPILVQLSAAAATSNTGESDGKHTGGGEIMELAEEMHWIKPQPPPAVAAPPAEPPVSALASKSNGGRKDEENRLKEPADPEMVTEGGHKMMLLPIIKSRRLLIR